jgi:nicotinate phosphoribosyltransferase
MIIKSLLDTDFYSFTQQQAILHQFPSVNVKYKFKCRNEVDLTPHLDEIRYEIDALCNLVFLNEELDYLRSIPFIKVSYIDFLKNFKLQRECVHVYTENKELCIDIKGNWFQTVLFEVPILAIVNEVYFNSLSFVKCPSNPNRGIGWTNLISKIQLVKDYESKFTVPHFKFADFGTRRRYARIWQECIVEDLIKELPSNFIGTSNVYLAKKYGVKPIGTMSHQWIMVGQGLPNVRISESQKYMLDAWVKEYRGDLGIALSDTLGFDAFLQDFDPFFAKLYDGCRHDSGDPFAWCDKLIAHYKKLKIDPRTKAAVFSDGLTFPLALDLCSEFHDQIQTSFGIGTNLTNDCGFDPLQIVIKLTEVNGHPVAKISDSSGKGMCQDAEYLKYLKKVFNIPT